MIVSSNASGNYGLAVGNYGNAAGNRGNAAGKYGNAAGNCGNCCITNSLTHGAHNQFATEVQPIVHTYTHLRSID